MDIRISTATPNDSSFDNLLSVFSDTNIKTNLHSTLLQIALDAENKVVSVLNNKHISNTGRLAQGFRVDEINDLVVELSNDTPYAKFVNYGTKPHTPPFAPIQRWAHLKLGGSDDVAWKVWQGIRKHGTKPTHFFEEAIESVELEHHIAKFEEAIDRGND